MRLCQNAAETGILWLLPGGARINRKIGNSLKIAPVLPRSGQGPPEFLQVLRPTAPSPRRTTVSRYWRRCGAWACAFDTNGAHLAECRPSEGLTLHAATPAHKQPAQNDPRMARAVRSDSCSSGRFAPRRRLVRCSWASFVRSWPRRRAADGDDGASGDGVVGGVSRGNRLVAGRDQGDAAPGSYVGCPPRPSGSTLAVALPSTAAQTMSIPLYSRVTPELLLLTVAPGCYHRALRTVHIDGKRRVRKPITISGGESV